MCGVGFGDDVVCAFLVLALGFLRVLLLFFVEEKEKDERMCTTFAQNEGANNDTRQYMLRCIGLVS